MIRELRLVNVKSYSDQIIRFGDGVNAIIGENGAGKTTILEAIGFTMFNALPYNISDFVRRGERRAEIRVKIINPKDDRIYEIVRRIEDGRTVEYFVRDAETGVRIGGAEGVAGVAEWVREVFGFEVDAKTVFENAVGVPQGKITSQFLESPSVRDRIFSPLIGVEGYKKAFEKSREYERFLENKLRDVETEIALLRKDVENLGRLRKRLEELEAERRELSKRISDVEERIVPLESRISEMEGIRREISNLKVDEAKLSAEERGIASNVERLKGELESLKRAEEELESLKEVYESYVKAEKELEGVVKEKREIERRMEELRRKELELEKLKAELENLRKRLEEIERCERELEKIEELARREEELMEKIREIEIAESRKKSLEEQRRRVEEDLRAIEVRLKALREKEEELRVLEEKLGKIPKDIELRRDKLIQAIAKLKQMLDEERRQFEKIKSGRCPILGVECERIAKAAKAKEEKMAKISRKIEDFERKLTVCEKVCSKKKEIEERVGTIRAELEAKEELVAEFGRKRELLEAIKEELDGVERIIGMREEIENELKRVKGSIERRIALTDKVRRKGDVLREIEEKESAVVRISDELGELEGLRMRMEELRGRELELEKVLRESREGYMRYVRLREEVSRKEELESELESLENKLRETKSKLESVRNRLRELERLYDEEEFERLRDELQKLRDLRSKLEGEVGKIGAQIEELRGEVEELKGRKERLERLEEERERVRRKLKFVKDVREIFKRAIPEITKAYVEAVSVEANRIFCEIMGDYNWELRWTEDFGIKAKYMGRDIDFSQMSGGEQVCAALAVRLALLKVLSNMRVVFFDEPTQNMDETRRRNFATQLSKIEGFKQIFVISHDDTFEEMVENAIKIKKENGISVVV